MEDYFAALELSRGATPEQIDAKIKQELRTWQRRTTNPDLARRQEAERRLRLLAEAREVLLDDQKRAEYLAALAASVPTPVAGGGPQDQRAGADVEQWLSNGRAYLAKGDYPAALYAAREARKANAQSAEAWNLLARANMSMGAVREALSEARRASDLDPSNPGYYFVQGRIYEQLGQLGEAGRSYEVAARLNPKAEAPRLAAANIVAQGEKPEEALPLLEDIFERSDDKQQTGTVLANCLVRVAESVPRKRTATGYLITAADEVDAMERLLFRARMVSADPETVRYVEAVADNVKWAKDRHVRKLDKGIGCAGLVAAVAAIAGLFLLFAFLGTFEWLAGLLALLCLGGAGVYAWWVWVPGHVLNRKLPGQQ